MRRIVDDFFLANYFPFRLVFCLNRATPVDDSCGVDVLEPSHDLVDDELNLTKKGFHVVECLISVITNFLTFLLL